MNSAVFRSAEFWKSALMTLPDNSFFELLRNVFGKIKTPYNKQILLNNLETFLLRDDIQKTIAAYISHDDARLITAVAVLKEPASGEMESFFSGELSYAELQDLIINLEERFIFYRFREDDRSRLALNPILEPVLAPFIADISLLFPSLPADDAAASMTADETTGASSSTVPALNDRVLAGLLSFAAEEEPFFKTEGEIRKRIIDAAGRVFPGLDLESVIGGLRTLGLFRAEDDRLIPDYRRFADFGKLVSRERMEYAAAGIYCFRDSGSSADISPYLFRAHLRDLAGFIHQFLESLETERLYPVKTLGRLAGILERANGEPGLRKINGAFLADALEKTGLLLGAGTEYRQLSFLAKDTGAASAAAASSDAIASGAKPEAPMIVMDAAFCCAVYPEISFADAVSLASVLSVREVGITLRLEMTRESALRAFDRGFSAETILDLLKRLSADRIDETLIWTLKEWEKRYGEVSLRRGLVLSLAPERRYLAEMEPLARNIKAVLAPGIYLLGETAERETLEALQKAGVDIVARPGKSSGAETPAEGPRNPFPPLRPGTLKHYAGRIPCPVRDTRQAKGTGGAGGKENGSALIAGFHAALEQMRLNRAERDELAARIDRRLVLCESQLKDASIRYEKLEARGLDYAGKALIAKQAIALQSPVELVWPGPPGGRKGRGSADKNERRIFGIPKSLDKEASENILVISPFNESNGNFEPIPGDTVRIPLGKISLLRRIKKSIFETSP
jgi:hypothetical protein